MYFEVFISASATATVTSCCSSLVVVPVFFRLYCLATRPWWRGGGAAVVRGHLGGVGNKFAALAVGVVHQADDKEELSSKKYMKSQAERSAC